MHVTDNLEDGYAGSGKILRNSINKYGIKAHQIEIVEFCETRKDLAEREKELVTLELLKNTLCMNLKVGGDGGLQGLSDEVRKKIQLAGTKAISDLNKKTRYLQKVLKEKFKDPDWRKRRQDNIAQAHLNRGHGRNGLLGSKASAHRKKVQKDTFKKINHQKGDKNSQFGTTWFTDGVNNIKIKGAQTVPIGFTKGRTIKHALGADTVSSAGL